VIRVGVVSPVRAVRAGLRTMLNPAPLGEASELEITGEAASLEGYVPLISKTDVLVITDDAAAGPVLRTILASSENQVALLLLTDNPQAARGLSGLPTRAWGVLPIDATIEELQAAVRALHEGLLVGAPALLGPSLSRTLVAETDNPDAPIEPLTERENQVLQLLARGLANKQIAITLGISEHTAKFHISSIYTKLGVTNRTAAVRVGIQQGIISL
jgi:DNA-binding NarL/FixJ family response regulator